MREPPSSHGHVGGVVLFRDSDNQTMGIYDRMKAGEPIRESDQDHDKVLAGYSRMMRITSEINCGYHDGADIRKLMGELTCSDIHESVTIIPPFYSDWG